MKHYTQLTHEQRYQIHACMKAGWDQTEIATEIGAHKSTVSRELRRNRGARGYRPKQAHALAMARRAVKFSTRLSPRDWSPDQASGRLETENGIVVSHEWIVNEASFTHVYADKHAGGNLHRHLRCQKARRKRYGAYDRRGSLPNRVSIEERPAAV